MAVEYILAEKIAQTVESEKLEITFQLSKTVAT